MLTDEILAVLDNSRSLVKSYKLYQALKKVCIVSSGLLTRGFKTEETPL